MKSIVRLAGEEVRLYSPYEAADYCGGPDGSVSVWTINKWRKEGWLRHIKVNARSFMYTKEALDECMVLKGYSNRIIKKEGEENDTIRESNNVLRYNNQ